MVKAIIFDFDGTLADTLPAMLEALNLMLRDYSQPQIDKAGMMSFINGTIEDFVKAVLPAEKLRTDGDIKAARGIYERYYSCTYTQTDRCYDGMYDLIGILKPKYRLSILSNKQQEYIDKLNSLLFPEGLFESVRGARSGCPGKPNPMSMMMLMVEMGISTDECVYIGDSDTDILTAKNAGVKMVCAGWGYRSPEYLHEHGASIVANNPSELLEILNKVLQ